MLPSNQQVAQAMIGSLEEIRRESLPKGSRILDFGCGSGDLVQELNRCGFDSRGVDIKPFWADDDLQGRLQVVEQPYRIPHADLTFDAVLSTSVFEHVLDYRRAFLEIHRVLKPGGASLHLFPGPWALPVEPHMFVPLASVIQTRWWLGLWARLGVRNGFQKGLGWREVTERNFEYCKTGVNYLPRRKVKHLVTDIFGNFYYAKKEYINNFHGGAARLARRTKLPFTGEMIFAWRDQLVYAVKQSS